MSCTVYSHTVTIDFVQNTVFAVIYLIFHTIDINLQSLCLAKLSTLLKSDSDIDTLPLPAKLKVYLKQYHE